MYIATNKSEEIQDGHGVSNFQYGGCASITRSKAAC